MPGIYREIGKPFSYKGHRVVWVKGFCKDCFFQKEKVKCIDLVCRGCQRKDETPVIAQEVKSDA